VPNDDFGRTPLQRLCGSLRNKGFFTDQPMEFTFDTPVWTLKGRQFDDRVTRKGAFGEEPSSSLINTEQLWGNSNSCLPLRARPNLCPTG
jgi:hypothetical protein